MAKRFAVVSDFGDYAARVAGEAEAAVEVEQLRAALGEVEKVLAALVRAGTVGELKEVQHKATVGLEKVRAALGSVP